MSRGNRGIILALVGIALSGASFPKSNHGEQSDNSADEVANSLESIASTFKDAQKPSKHDEPCAQGRDDRASDLCAQWKAADAAGSSAIATWVFGVIGSVIGLLTLGAAGAAAWYARKAAIYTEAGANEAARAAKAAEDTLEEARLANAAALRPYVFFGAADSETDRKPFTLESFREESGRIQIQNFGQMPARNLEISWGTGYFHRPIGDVTPNFIETHCIGDMGPGARLPITIDMPELSAEEVEGIKGGWGALLFRLKIDYAFGPNPTDRDGDEITMFVVKEHLGKPRQGHLLTDQYRQVM